MIELRLRYSYAEYKGKLYGYSTDYKTLVSHDIEDVNLGFVPEYIQGHEYYTKVVRKKRIDSAFKIETWGEIDGYSMRIWNLIDGKYTLEPITAEEAEHFGVGFAEPGRYHAVFKELDEINSIWEVRKPIEGFPFNTDEIVYLKKDGIWIEENCSGL
ncbi:hypothetical protein [Plebeiibacterium sediminum]|uniref:Uncharacterized protein n=1 Tax=Plebeiibacterium sediminum TaxID=2992112 RepID=A0AAE3M7E1_9BACT|nr:hypothetical protein [Plebeiobacterium sediminum]MCW3788483.1 hypothetical protein [Plebeiobacterium sediminum]